MKKIYAFISLLLTSGMIMLMLSACTQNNPNSQFSNNSQVSADLPNGYILHEMIFPESDAEKTDYNKDIFEITPFKIQVAFPEKWSIGEFDSQKNKDIYKQSQQPLSGYWLCVYASGSFTIVIFIFWTFIRVSCLHFGQNKG